LQSTTQDLSQAAFGTRAKAGLLQAVADLALEDLGQSALGEEEAGVLRLAPRQLVVGQCASGDEDVDVRVEEHGARPGMQYGEKTRGGRTEVAGVASEFEDRGGGGLHEHAVEDGGVGASDRAELGGQREGQEVEGAVQEQPRALCVEPAPGLFSVALGAVAVLAGVVGVKLLVAVVTAKDLAAERSRATGLDVRQGAVVTRQESPAELLPIVARHGGGRCPLPRASERSRREAAQRSLVSSLSGSVRVARTSRVRWV
jgi:hypothetical protein